MKKLNLNLGKMLSLRGVSLVLASTLALGMTGCSKKVDCNISGSHAHLYVSDGGYVRYINKEYEEYKGYERRDDYIPISKEDEKLYKFYEEKNLLRISDNLDVLSSVIEKNKDFLEYRYRYIYLLPMPHYISNGKTTTVYYTYLPMVGYSWTKNPNHSRLTGDVRECHYVYTAYKVEMDEKGKYVLIPSPNVDDVREVMGEYPFIKEENYYKIVNSLLGEEIDYEDGPSTLTPEEQEELDNEYGNMLNEDDKTLTKTK